MQWLVGAVGVSEADTYGFVLSGEGFE
jgi:hypothetical protein